MALVRMWGRVGGWEYRWGHTQYETSALAGAAQLVGAVSRKPKGRDFESQSGHTPGIVGSTSHRARWRFLSLSPPSLSLKPINAPLGENF